MFAASLAFFLYSYLVRFGRPAGGLADPDLGGLNVGAVPAPLRLSDGDELYAFNNETSTARKITVKARVRVDGDAFGQ